MPKPADNQIKLIHVWPLLTNSWLFFRANLGILIGYAAWMLLPYAAIIATYLIVNDFNQLLGPWLPLYVLLVLLQIIVALWAGNAIMLTINSLLSNDKIKIAEINSRSWRIIPSLLIVAIISGVAVMGGALLLIVPGIIFSIWFAFAQTAVVIDDRRGLDALSFSRSLIKGRFWPVLRRILLGPLIIFLIYWVVFSLIYGLGVSLGGPDTTLIADMSLTVWQDIISNILNIFFIPLFLTYWVILYRNLKEQ